MSCFRTTQIIASSMDLRRKFNAVTYVRHSVLSRRYQNRCERVAALEAYATISKTTHQISLDPFTLLQYEPDAVRDGRRRHLANLTNRRPYVSPLILAYSLHYMKT